MTSIRFVFVVARLMMFTVCAFGQGEQASKEQASDDLGRLFFHSSSGSVVRFWIMGD